jgi:cytochrome c oxidase assembly factor CtaG
MSPLDALSERFFSAHMTQHLILMLVAPPLVLLGRPENIMLWMFPLNGRRWVGNIWKRAGAFGKYLNKLAEPVSVWLLATFVMWFWHMPKPYSWAFNHPAIHIIEHLSFFATSLAFWRLCLKPFNREGGGHMTAIVLLFTFMFQSALLGALLTFAHHPLYKEHAVNHFSGLSPLADQQLAGLIMWIPAGAVQLLALALLFHHWLSNFNPSSRADKNQGMSRLPTALG